MKKYGWNDNWKFFQDTNSFALIWSVPEDAEEVCLPHDAMIESDAHAESPNGTNTGWRDGSSYTYVKTLDVPESWRGKKTALHFDGIYEHASIFVNGMLAGKTHNGYIPVDVSLNQFLNYGGSNEIRVQVKTGAMTNSRWYSGSGIYRDVWLEQADSLVFVQPDSLRVTTQWVSEDGSSAQVLVEAVIRNDSSEPVVVQGMAVIQGPNAPAADVKPCSIPAGSERKLRWAMTVANPALWSDESPSLYGVTVSVIRSDVLLQTVEVAGDGGKLDEASATFGIRVIKADSGHGLTVNGKRVLLRGACIHHDSGIIGAATYLTSELRRIRILKEAGFNAIRMAHHHCAPVLMDACDQLGMYIMDEYSDMWTRTKSTYDYALNFSECWQHDVSAMVADAYNHPSVIMYSVGNEIPEIGGLQGSAICAEIAELVKAEDPTRLTTAGINGVFAAGDQLFRIVKDIDANANVNQFMQFMDGHLDEIVVHDAISEKLAFGTANLDVAGYNYMTARYELDAKVNPHRVIVGSETYPPEIARNWGLMNRLTNVIGDFTWTGWDYIGEAGIGVPAYRWGEGGFAAGWPCQLAYVGDIDITGFRRPMSYYREVVFGLRTDPYICVQDPAHFGEHLITTPWVMNDVVASWDWPAAAGKPCVVEVYAPGDEVELLVNGVSCGRKPSGWKAGSQTAGGQTAGSLAADSLAAGGASVAFRTLFEVTYQLGTVEAVCYAGGQEISRSVLVSPSGCSVSGTDHGALCSPAASSAASGRQLLIVDDTVGDSAAVSCVSGGIAGGADNLRDVRVFGAATIGGSAQSSDVCGSVANLRDVHVSAAVCGGTAVGRVSAATIGDSAAQDVHVSGGGSRGATDLRFLQISITDAAGVVCTSAVEKLTVTVDGPVEVLGFGSANPKPAENYNTGHTTTWNGRAQLIVKVPAAAGTGSACGAVGDCGIDEGHGTSAGSVSAPGNVSGAKVRICSESGLCAEFSL